MFQPSRTEDERRRFFQNSRYEIPNSLKDGLVLRERKEPLDSQNMRDLA